MYSIILCGGSGTRLWPLSRKNFAKQFLKLYSDKSLLQETFLRMKNIVGEKNVYFVTNKDNYFNVYNQVREVCPDFAKEQVILEPAAMNTAPAIALGMKYLSEKVGIKEDDPVIVNPSDHYIGNPEQYAEVVKNALQNVGDNVGTIGITPTSPETGFGYIKKGEKENIYFRAQSFKEKPDKSTAQQYLESGDYVWNGGMYLFSSKTFASELQKYAAGLYEKYAQGWDSLVGDYESLEAKPIDTEVSEKSDRIVIFEGDFGWSDIGSFDVLSQIASQNEAVNSKHVFIDSKGVYAHSENNKMIATLGIEDVIVVESNDVIFIQKKGRSEEVKKVVEYLKEHNCPEVEHNIVVYRPWGKYEVLVNDTNHKVKKITVFPGAALSLQSHNRRAEHWVVVKGEATVVNGDATLKLKENESTYIPATAKHQLANYGVANLEIIEVQTGDYLEEDDIIRYKDEYGRDTGVSA